MEEWNHITRVSGLGFVFFGFGLRVRNEESIRVEVWVLGYVVVSMFFSILLNNPLKTQDRPKRTHESSESPWIRVEILVAQISYPALRVNSIFFAIPFTAFEHLVCVGFGRCCAEAALRVWMSVGCEITFRLGTTTTQ